MVATRRRIRRWLGLPMAAGGLVIFAIGVWGSTASADPPLLGDFSVSGPVVSVAGGNTTYVWTLTGSHGHETEERLDVSHVVVDTCLDNTEVGGNFGSDWGQDGTHTYQSSQIYGHKWEGDPAVGAIFSLTFPGVLDASGSANVFIAKGGDHKLVVTGGPNCGTSTTSTTTTSTSTTTTSTSTTSTTSTSTTTSTIASAGEPTTTTTAAVGGIVETTTTAAEVKGVVVERERPRAAPEELAFTGDDGSGPFLVVTGLVLMALGALTQVLLRRRTAS